MYAYAGFIRGVGVIKSGDLHCVLGGIEAIKGGYLYCVSWEELGPSRVKTYIGCPGSNRGHQGWILILCVLRGIGAIKGEDLHWVSWE